MNEMNDPHPVNNKEAEHILTRLAPWLLGLDVVLAALIWLFRETIFGPQAADQGGTMLAIALIVAGLFTYVMLKKVLGKRLNRSEE